MVDRIIKVQADYNRYLSYDGHKTRVLKHTLETAGNFKIRGFKSILILGSFESEDYKVPAFLIVCYNRALLCPALLT